LWAIVKPLRCPGCKERFLGNEGIILANLPPYAASAYPVETKCAARNNSHLGRNATDVFDLLMTTYGNGDLCSRLLYNAMNRAFVERAASYYSFHAQSGGETMKYIEKDSEFIRMYPPQGDALRDAYDDASNNANNHWFLSDHDRHTRELQAVQCSRLYAEDHTHEMTKNYFRRRQIGAVALWDVATETGEIATAVLVPSTKTKDLSHAAMSLSRRHTFNPKAVYSDRWPVKIDYWERVFGSTLEGRLGLFHFTQRIIRTLKKRHIDCFSAINHLLDCVYFYNEEDYEKLLIALKDGTLNGKKHTDEDIADLKATKTFRNRYGKYLRKEIRQTNTICDRIDQWFIRFKVQASDGAMSAQGRLDPISGETLFTPETKVAVINCKEKCQYLQDPLPLNEMYDVIRSNPNSPHGLVEYLSRRGESNLESFHLMLAHFGNTGMRESLVDNLNLTGACRYNLNVRNKLRLATEDAATRIKIPAGWETVISYTNHTELRFINSLARRASVMDVPFPNTESLPDDNGERFFSEY